MKIFDLFYEGGPLFMGIVSVWTILMLVFAIQKVIHIFLKRGYSRSGLDLILLFGSLAFVCGILGQSIGLVAAFDAIESAGDISPGLMAGGFKVSMITTIYGFLVFIVSLLLWGILREIIIRKEDES